MFFSNQLLSRKGPLGQIWIVATMQSKLNRRKTEQINIEEICMQVLQPQVPLALRLTGILMGGIVLIYDRKVRILYEDVHEFLFQLKTAVDAKGHPDKNISLPPAKLHAKFENVTITYDFDTFEDIERAMYAPDTPSKDEEDNMDQEEYVSTAGDPYRRLSISGDSKRFSSSEISPSVPTISLNQVSSEYITLPEPNVSDSLQQYEDLGKSYPPSENMFMDQFFPEVNIPSDSLPQMPSPIHNEFEPETKTSEPSEQRDTDQPVLERSPPEEAEQVEGPEPMESDQGAAASAPAPANLKRRRVRGVAARKTVFDEEYTEIPAPVFASWIRDTSDIRERYKKPPTGKDPGAARAHRHLDLPSVCLLSPTCIQDLEPFWSPQLAQLWERTLTGKVPPPTDRVVELQDSRRDPSVKPGTPVRMSAQSSDPSNPSFEAASQENSSPKPAEVAGDFNEPNELRDYGSAEKLLTTLKLRTALQSPSGGSDDFFGSLHGPTPGQQQGFSRLDRSTPGSSVSSKRSLDLERDLPTGSSGRFKRPRQSTSPRIFDSTPPGLDGIGSNYDLKYDSNHKESQISVTRFDLMQETHGDTAQEPMKIHVSSSLLQYLIDGFNQQGPWSMGSISMFEISEGLKREEASRLFYQICVKQEEPYGDILLGRGIYL